LKLSIGFIHLKNFSDDLVFDSKALLVLKVADWKYLPYLQCSYQVMNSVVQQQGFDTALVHIFGSDFQDQSRSCLLPDQSRLTLSRDSCPGRLICSYGESLCMA
jgi:hypothetical protein